MAIKTINPKITILKQIKLTKIVVWASYSLKDYNVIGHDFEMPKLRKNCQIIQKRNKYIKCPN